MTTRVLIVDDDMILRRLFGKRLIQSGMEVFYAVDGIEGLNQIHANQPDVIVLDIHMPRMNGIEMLQQLRGTAVGQDMHVIVVTADIAPENLESIDLADRVLAKPVSAGDIHEAVTDYLNAGAE